MRRRIPSVGREGGAQPGGSNETGGEAEGPVMIARIVHYVLDAGHNVGAHRPAIVVNDLGGGKLAMTVFCDAGRDGLGVTFAKHGCAESQMMEPGTWHWPEGMKEYPQPVADIGGQRPEVGLADAPAGEIGLDAWKEANRS